MQLIADTLLGELQSAVDLIVAENNGVAVKVGETLVTSPAGLVIVYKLREPPVPAVILMVEDDRAASDAVRELLEVNGYRSSPPRTASRP